MEAELMAGCLAAAKMVAAPLGMEQGAVVAVMEEMVVDPLVAAARVAAGVAMEVQAVEAMVGGETAGRVVVEVTALAKVELAVGFVGSAARMAEVEATPEASAVG